jgi:type II secretory pathway component PulM
MRARLGAWWRARTRRERLLLQFCAGLALCVAAPLWLFSAAAGFRDGAAGALAQAEDARRGVQALSASGARRGPPMPAHDGSLNGLAFAAAAAHGLTIERVEGASADRLRVVFAAAADRAVFAWLDEIARAGVSAPRSALVRAGANGLIRAEFDLARTPAG